MKPILFKGTATDYSTFGLGVLSDTTECVVKEDLEGGFTLSMKYPTNGIHYSDIKLNSIVGAKVKDREDVQGFRIYSISEPIKGAVTIDANHISYDMSYYTVMPKISDDLERPYQPEQYLGEGIDNTLENAIAQCFPTPTEAWTIVKDPAFQPKDFGYEVLTEEPEDWSTNWKDYYTKNAEAEIIPVTEETCPEFIAYKYFMKKPELFEMNTPTSLRAILGDSSNGISKIYGGEWLFDNHKATLVKERGSDKGFHISYAHNMTDFKRERKNDKMYTHILPFAAPTAGTETTRLFTIRRNDTYEEYPKYEDAPLIKLPGEYDYMRVLAVDLTQSYDGTEGGLALPLINARLDELAQQYISENEMGDKSDETITLSFIELSMPPFNVPGRAIDLGDTVHVFYKQLGVEITKRCISSTYNVLLDRYDSIEVGDKNSSVNSTDTGGGIVGTLVSQTSLVSSASSTSGNVAKVLGAITYDNGEGQTRIDGGKIQTNSITTDKLDVTDLLSAKSGFIDKLTSNEAFISQLVSSDIYAENMRGKYLEYNLGNFKEVIADTAGIKNLFGQYMFMENVDIGEDLRVSGEIVGATIRGDKIIANTITADKLLIQGEDGVYYRINVNAIGEMKVEEAYSFLPLEMQPENWSSNWKDYYEKSATGSFVHISGETTPIWQPYIYYRAENCYTKLTTEPKNWKTNYFDYYEVGTDGYYRRIAERPANEQPPTFEPDKYSKLSELFTESIDGKVIAAQSVTAEKINVKELAALNATIGGTVIESGSIHTAAKTNLESGAPGFYLDSGGNMTLGNQFRYNNNGTLRIGEAPYYTEYTGNKITFYGPNAQTSQEPVEQARIETNSFTFKNGVVEQTLRIGNLMFIPRSNGNMSLKYAGQSGNS